MPAYKDIDAKEMAVLARIIVDQNDTAEQQKCVYCHADPLALSKTLMPELVDKLKQEGMKWCGSIYLKAIGLSAIAKFDDGFYQLEYNAKQREYDLREIKYCNQCGRFLKD